MTDEIILKLIHSASYEDLVLGFTYLSARPILKIREFFEKHGQNRDLLTEAFAVKKEIKLKYEHEICGYIKKKRIIIWFGAQESYILKTKYWEGRLNKWRDHT